MKTRTSQLILACTLLLGGSACQRAAYPTLPKTTAYHQPSVKRLPITAPEPVVKAISASASPNTPLAPKQATGKKATYQLAKLPKEVIGGIRLPVLGSRTVGQSQPSARVLSRPHMAHRRIGTPKSNTAAIQEPNILEGLGTIFIIALIMLALGLVGVFAFSVIGLKILFGLMAFIGAIPFIAMLIYLTLGSL